MKHLVLLTLVSGVCFTTAAQQSSELITAIVIAKDATTNKIITWNKVTGRLTSFNSDGLDFRGIAKGDSVTINSLLNKITSISGTARTYDVQNATAANVHTVINNRATPAQPCCAIVSIQPDPIEPCCNIVSVKNNVSNKLSTFKAPKAISDGFTVSQLVNFEPVSGIRILSDSLTGFAVLQSAYGTSNGEITTYGYPITGGEGVSGATRSYEKWTIAKVPALKGASGRLVMSFPKGLNWNVTIYSLENKYLKSFTHAGNIASHVILAGEYKMKLNNAEVLNVPIQPGHDTKLKFGILNIVSDTSWTVYDETGEKYITSGTKPSKLILPVGTYTLELGGGKRQFIIGNGETAEF